jgi:hypothetical protein
MMLRFVLVVALAAFAAQKPANVQKALHSVEWTDAAGDVERINTSAGTVPGFDVVKLGLTSDGTRLTITATLKGPVSGSFASDVVQIYVDTDNSPTTGYKTFWSNLPGFELEAKLDACVDYADGGTACSGSLGGKVKGYHAVATLGRIIDASGNTKDIVGAFDAPAVPITGAVVSASLTYANLGVKSGQVIRLVARESCGPSDATADFPVTVLTLK